MLCRGCVSEKEKREEEGGEREGRGGGGQRSVSQGLCRDCAGAVQGLCRGYAAVTDCHSGIIFY